MAARANRRANRRGSSASGVRPTRAPRTAWASATRAAAGARRTRRRAAPQRWPRCRRRRRRRRRAAARRRARSLGTSAGACERARGGRGTAAVTLSGGYMTVAVKEARGGPSAAHCHLQRIEKTQTTTGDLGKTVGEWRLRGGPMAVTWRLHGGYMEVTWRLHRVPWNVGECESEGGGSERSDADDEPTDASDATPPRDDMARKDPVSSQRNRNGHL